MTKQQILEYILKTPNNTNPNVLAPMIDSLISNTEKVEDFSSAVTAIKSGKNLVLSEDINADDEVTADGAVNVEVSLNGKELKASAKCGNWLLCAQNGAKMVIDGKGLVSIGNSEKLFQLALMLALKSQFLMVLLNVVKIANVFTVKSLILTFMAASIVLNQVLNLTVF